ncbi:MAG: FAD-dependent oxidoreductase [Acidobacteria bacterium]|nr:FAD-dependent oxidoreductase [Acidobacteriota bacterium]
MRRDLRRLADSTFDLVVVGAGIYGAIAAWDATARGLSVALLDRGDFGSGTSFNSLKTLHGGLRSLRALDLRQMRLFIRERRAMARVAPHLVRVLPCVVPTYRDPGRSAPLMRLALLVNDLVARDRNAGLDGAHTHIPASAVVSRDACLELNPLVDPAGVTGGAIWHDYQMTSPDRVTLAFVRSASTAGAVTANYVAATRLLITGQRVEGVTVRDACTDSTFDVHAGAVLNAAGPWAASLLDNLPSVRATLPAPALSRAMNLVVRRLPGSRACGGLARGRFLFAVPWQSASILGTSHDPHDGAPDLRVTRAHVEGLLAEAREAFPRAGLAYGDVRLVHRGLLPMVSSANGHVQLLRESVVVDHRSQGVDGLVSMVGVRYTTARDTAEKATDAVFRTLGYARPPACRTEVTPLDTSDLDAIAALQSLQGLEEPIGAESTTTGAEIVHAARAEAAVHLADAVIRRTGIGAAGRPSDQTLARAAELMGAELGWSDEQRRREIAEVDAFYELPA